MFLKVFVSVFLFVGTSSFAQTPFHKLIAAGDFQQKSKSLDSSSKLKFYIIAQKQAQVWGDTILEGDYFAKGDTQLDSVFSLYKGSQQIGYLITYSETAWDTSNCVYRESDPTSLNTCLPGRIVESSYVSPDFTDYFYDENTWARFRPRIK